MGPAIKKAISSIRNHISPERLDHFLIHACSPNDELNLGGEEEKAYSFYEEETHAFFEIALVLEGSFLLKLGQRRYLIKPNQLCLIEMGITHQIGWIPSNELTLSILWFACRRQFVRLHLTQYHNNLAKMQYSYDVFHTDEYLLFELIRELKERQAGYREAVLSYLNAYLTVIDRRLEHPVAARATDSKHVIIAEARQYIARHLHTKLSLGEISNAVSVSPSHLSLLFKQLTGSTLTDYILETRIGKAKELLVLTDQKLSDISGMLGFYDQFYFSKVFKQSTGLSPSSYRSHPD